MYKRGISPLIATILLIGFTVILSFIVVNWIQGSIEDQTDDPVFDVELQNICLAAQTDFEFFFFENSFVGYSINVKNTGPNDFDDVKVLWVDSFGSIGNVSFSGPLQGFGNVRSAANPSGVYDSVRIVPIIKGFECNDFVATIDAFLHIYFLDSDGDNRGDPTSYVFEESIPSGYTIYDDDCNDGNPHENPTIAGPFCSCPGGASAARLTELCSDGVDNNCDGLVDAADPLCITLPMCTSSDTIPISGSSCDCNGMACAVGQFCCRTGVYAGDCTSSCFDIGP